MEHVPTVGDRLIPSGIRCGSAVANDSRAPQSTPAAASAARTSASRATLRTVVRTSYPCPSSVATHHPPRNPVPPVTNTVPVESFMRSP
jgi:hypothetical protein